MHLPICRKVTTRELMVQFSRKIGRLAPAGLNEKPTRQSAGAFSLRSLYTTPMSMRGILVAVACAVGMGGCSCQGSDITGTPDSATDTAPDLGHEEEPLPECWDLDEDGHQDEVCGGDDCNDSDPTVHPGADDVCLDGVDRDCDGIVDGPMLLGSVVQLARHPGDGHGAGLHHGTLAWTGSEHVVSYTRWESSSTGGGIVDSYLSRLDRDGRLTMNGVWLWNRITSQFAWSGRELGFVDANIPSSPGLRFQRVALSGSVMTDPLLVSFDGNHGNITWTGEDYVLFWRNCLGSDDICYGRLDAGGMVTHEGIPITDHAGDGGGDSLAGMTILWNGSATGLAWQESVDGVEGHEEVIFASVPHDHTRLVTKKRITYSASLNRWPALAWTESEYGIVWDVHGEETGIMFARVDTDGDLVDEPRSLADAGIGPSISWTGSEFGVGYGSETEPDGQISLIIISASGTTEEGAVTIPLASSKYSEDAQQVWTGSEFALVWTDIRDETMEVLFQRIGLCE